jgi:RNA polymerase sigma-70 factor (ECF subfamily)
LLLHHSRRRARVDAANHLITLEDQDRSQWDANDIARGLELIESALRMGRPGPFQLQAAIAALHSEARTPAATDWPQIAALYCELERFTPTPVVALNKAVAIGMSEGPQAGLDLLGQIGAGGRLDHYHLFHAAQADLLRRLGDFGLALDAYSRAVSLAQNTAEREFLSRRIAELSAQAH